MHVQWSGKTSAKGSADPSRRPVHCASESIGRSRCREAGERNYCAKLNAGVMHWEIKLKLNDIGERQCKGNFRVTAAPVMAAQPIFKARTWRAEVSPLAPGGSAYPTG